MNNIMRVMAEETVARKLGCVERSAQQRKLINAFILCLQFYQQGMENLSAICV